MEFFDSFLGKLFIGLIIATIFPMLVRLIFLKSANNSQIYTKTKNIVSIIGMIISILIGYNLFALWFDDNTLLNILGALLGMLIIPITMMPIAILAGLITGLIENLITQKKDER